MHELRYVEGTFLFLFQPCLFDTVVVIMIMIMIIIYTIYLQSPRIDAFLMGVVAAVYMVLAIIGLWLNKGSDQYKALSASADADEDEPEVELHHNGKLLLVFLIYLYILFYFIVFYYLLLFTYNPQDDDRCPYEYANVFSRATFW